MLMATSLTLQRRRRTVELMTEILADICLTATWHRRRSVSMDTEMPSNSLLLYHVRCAGL